MAALGPDSGASRAIRTAVGSAAGSVDRVVGSSSPVAVIAGCGATGAGAGCGTPCGGVVAGAGSVAVLAGAGWAGGALSLFPPFIQDGSEVVVWQPPTSRQADSAAASAALPGIRCQRFSSAVPFRPVRRTPARDRPEPA
ncbi:hypothetical protein GCM10027256_04270 [Novispirillum itersonii subsp. nipponicum]